MEERLDSTEPLVTERDLRLLMMNESSLVALGAVLGLQAKAVPGDLLPMGLVEARAS